jgi:hypothetical protein
MKSHSTSHRRGLAVTFAFVFGVGIAGFHHAALARMGDTVTAAPGEVSAGASSSGVIMAADKGWDGDGRGNKNGNGGNNGNWNGKSGNWNGNGGNNGNWNKGGNNGNWNKGGNSGNWNKGGNNGNWNKGGNYGNWNKGGKYGNWNKYGNWGNNNHWNNNWNRGWNNRAYVRGWSHRPYYGQFFGGVVLGSILAATGAGVVPYSPYPELCWYWADPYMYRGYWDYCY